MVDNPDGQPPADPFDDDFDDEEFFAAWEAAEREAAGVLVEALEETPAAGVERTEIAEAAERLRQASKDGDPGAAWMLRAAGIETPDAIDDDELLIEAVAATISMADDPELPAEEAASIMALELGDWVGAILGLVRAGPGSPADAETLVGHIEHAPEVEGPALDHDDRVAIAQGFELVLPAWVAAGAVTDLLDPTLTRVGAWLLPAAAVWAWGPIEE